MGFRSEQPRGPLYFRGRNFDCCIFAEIIFGEREEFGQKSEGIVVLDFVSYERPRSVVHPETFLAKFLDRVTLFWWCIEATPILVQTVHEVVPITRKRNLTLCTAQDLR